jgi:hypothetical protein
MNVIRTMLAAGLLGTPILTATTVEADAPRSAGNGYVMMVHGTFAPNVYDASSGAVAPVPEAVAATDDDGWIVFNVIPHGLNGVPVIVADAVLVITATGGTHIIEVPANGSAASQPECAIETQYPSFEGPLEACQVFRVPAATFDDMPLVDLTLRFTDDEGAQVEVNSVLGHVLLHLYQDGAPIDLEQVDRYVTGTTTPFAIENLIDASH